MDNIDKQKIENNQKNNKADIKFQIQKKIKRSKCKSRKGTIYKLYSPKRFTIQPMKDEYFDLEVAVELMKT